MKMNWPFRKNRFRPAAGDEWITIPFRFAEAARVSIHTIGSQPELPAQLRWWIAAWLNTYNSQLVSYMRNNYGPDIFPILDRITLEVMSVNASSDSGRESSWEKWESELRED